MAGPKRLTLFVEGDGDREAAPILVGRLLREMNPPPWDVLFLDNQKPFEVGNVSKLVPHGRRRTPDFERWRNLLQAAYRTRKSLGAILLLLDGDTEQFNRQPFCPINAAQKLTEMAVEVGGGTLFSVAVVFAMMEFESWLLAGFGSLSDRLPDVNLPLDIEQRRDAKGLLNSGLRNGYKSTQDQAKLTEAIDLKMVRAARLRSFRRLEDALRQLVAACRTGSPILSPQPIPQ